MRRLILLVMLCALAVSNLGCIMILGVRDLPGQRQVVEIDGELYTVDLDRHCLRKVEMDLAAEIEEANAGDVETEGE